MAKARKQIAEKATNRRAGIPVTARKVLKSGQLSKKELKFESMSAAAREIWEENPKSAARNIAMASLEEGRTAYGYKFTRD